MDNFPATKHDQPKPPHYNPAHYSCSDQLDSRIICRICMSLLITLHRDSAQHLPYSFACIEDHVTCFSAIRAALRHSWCEKPANKFALVFFSASGGKGDMRVLKSGMLEREIRFHNFVYLLHCNLFLFTNFCRTEWIYPVDSLRADLIYPSFHHMTHL